MHADREIGASAEAIQLHYDVGNDFYALWLDESMTYTAATFAVDGEPLARAQERKIDDHARAARVAPGSRVLDVGCGWGGALRRLADVHGARGVGLTLSAAQVEWCATHPHPDVEVRLESWQDHAPAAPYDAIVSVEAFEAFARPGIPVEDKIAGYRAFFDRCHAWLRPGGWMSLQTIAYGNSGPEDFDPFIASEIFPEQDLPRLSEIAAAIERRFEIVSLENDRASYALTLRDWRRRLRANQERALAVAGAETARRFDRYLRLSQVMFDTGTCDLYRIALRRVDQPRPTKEKT